MMKNHETVMWKMLKERAHNEPGRTVRIAEHAPVHKQRACNLTKYWERHGLVVTTSNGARAMLTRDGVVTENPP